MLLDVRHVLDGISSSSSSESSLFCWNLFRYLFSTLLCSTRSRFSRFDMADCWRRCKFSKREACRRWKIRRAVSYARQDIIALYTVFYARTCCCTRFCKRVPVAAFLTESQSFLVLSRSISRARRSASSASVYLFLRRRCFAILSSWTWKTKAKTEIRRDSHHFGRLRCSSK